MYVDFSFLFCCFVSEKGWSQVGQTIASQFLRGAGPDFEHVGESYGVLMTPS
jgi:hypothetical protein